MSSNDFTSHDRSYVTPLPKADLVGRLRQHADAEIHNKLRYIVRADKLMRAAADRISSLESELHRHHASLFMRATQLAGEPFVPVELAHSIAMDVSPIREQIAGPRAKNQGRLPVGSRSRATVHATAVQRPLRRPTERSHDCQGLRGRVSRRNLRHHENPQRSVQAWSPIRRPR